MPARPALRHAARIGDNRPVLSLRQDRYYINGRFLAQRTTGVQRVATQHVLALDALVGGLPGHWTLLCPAGTVPPPLRHIVARFVAGRPWPSHLWEQVALPWAARDGLLVNLAGAAPWFALRQACLLHDAAVFDHPGAYSAAFVLWYRLLFARLARSAVPLMTVSEFSRQRLAACLKVAVRRIALVPNGADHLNPVEADTTTVARFGLEQHPFLLAVASENPTKNLRALVSAFAGLSGRGELRLVLVGGRNDRVFARTSAPADPPGVVRTGPLGDPALKALYRRAVALVFPSLYEGFGLPPLEAMSCGCPVLAAHAAALPEVCGGAVRYFDPHSVEAIATALREVLADSALRHRLSEAGTERAGHFRWLESGAALLRALQTGSA